MNRVILFMMFLCVTVATFAQDKIASSVFGNGSAATSGGNFKIVGTVGQPAIGPASNNDHTQLAGFWYTTFALVTSVEQIEDELLPTEFRLEQNYPNPFNPSTTIAFAIAKISHVSIKIYDILGRQVATLVDEEHQPGTYKAVFEAGRLASGLYVYRILADDFQEVKKLMLLK